MFVQAVIFTAIICLIEAGNHKHRIVYQWNVIEPEWRDQKDREKALANESYIPENNQITGIKLWKNQLYLAIPRLMNGVPATLTVIPADPEQCNQDLENVNIDLSPKLKPFPSWEMQSLGDCNAFQFVQSMEIDPAGRMWVIDNGRTGIMTNNPNTTCPPKLVILDLESGGTVLRNYTFPPDIVDYQSIYLSDIVLDHEDGGFAYITDSGHKDPGIIVYSLAEDLSWKVSDYTMWAEDEAKMFTVDDVSITLDVNVNSIALSSSSTYSRHVYYSPLAAFHLYSISTSALKHKLSYASDFIKKIGIKDSQTAGMAMTFGGTLFFGLLSNNSIAYFQDTSEIFENWSEKNQTLKVDMKVFAKDDDILQWPDSFAIDETKFLWVVTNRLQNFLINDVNVNETNFRVIKFPLKSKNYQYNKDGSIPELPIITPQET